MVQHVSRTSTMLQGCFLTNVVIFKLMLNPIRTGDGTEMAYESDKGQKRKTIPFAISEGPIQV